MRPLPFVWPYALVFWAVYAWAFLPEWRVVTSGYEAVKGPDSKDRGSLKVIMGGMWMALLIAYLVAFVRAGFFPHSWQLPLFIAGVLMIFLGSLLRRYCFRTLGKYFTGDVRAAPDQPVISSGPYRLVRHPSYTAGMIMSSESGWHWVTGSVSHCSPLRRSQLTPTGWLSKSAHSSRRLASRTAAT